MLCKKDVLFCHVSMMTFFARNGDSHERVLFSPDYFTIDENERNLFPREFICSSTINEFRTGTLRRVLSYSTEHLKVPGNYR